MALPGFEELIDRADTSRAMIPVVAAGAADETVLGALARAAARGWAAPILVDDPAAIRQAAKNCGVDLGTMRIVASADPASAAVAEIRSGAARILMKGQLETPALLRAILDAETGLRTGRTICQVVLMEIIDQKRQFLLADTGITIEPSLAQKSCIVKSVVETARELGTAAPRIAIVAASEKENPAMPETLDAAELQRRGEQGEFGEALVQGPLSFDLAYAADAAKKKHIAGEVTGAADALIFPNLSSANLTVKAIMYTSHCRYGGVLKGAGCPVVFMSRADSVETRMNSMAMALSMIP